LQLFNNKLVTLFLDSSILLKTMIFSFYFNKKNIPTVLLRNLIIPFFFKFNYLNNNNLLEEESTDSSTSTIDSQNLAFENSSNNNRILIETQVSNLPAVIKNNKGCVSSYWSDTQVYGASCSNSETCINRNGNEIQCSSIQDYQYLQGCLYKKNNPNEFLYEDKDGTMKYLSFLSKNMLDQVKFFKQNNILCKETTSRDMFFFNRPLNKDFNYITESDSVVFEGIETKSNNAAGINLFTGEFFPSDIPYNKHYFKFRLENNLKNDVFTNENSKINIILSSDISMTYLFQYISCFPSDIVVPLTLKMFEVIKGQDFNKNTTCTSMYRDVRTNETSININVKTSENNNDPFFLLLLPDSKPTIKSEILFFIDYKDGRNTEQLSFDSFGNVNINPYPGFNNYKDNIKLQKQYKRFDDIFEGTDKEALQQKINIHSVTEEIFKTNITEIINYNEEISNMTIFPMSVSGIDFGNDKVVFDGVTEGRTDYPFLPANEDFYYGDSNQIMVVLPKNGSQPINKTRQKDKNISTSISNNTFYNSVMNKYIYRETRVDSIVYIDQEVVYSPEKAVYKNYFINLTSIFHVDHYKLIKNITTYLPVRNLTVYRAEKDIFDSLKTLNEKYQQNPVFVSKDVANNSFLYNCYKNNSITSPKNFLAFYPGEGSLKFFTTENNNIKDFQYKKEGLMKSFNNTRWEINFNKTYDLYFPNVAANQTINIKQLIKSRIDPVFNTYWYSWKSLKDIAMEMFSIDYLVKEVPFDMAEMPGMLLQSYGKNDLYRSVENAICWPNFLDINGILKNKNNNPLPFSEEGLKETRHTETNRTLTGCIKTDITGLAKQSDACLGYFCLESNGTNNNLTDSCVAPKGLLINGLDGKVFLCLVKKKTSFRSVANDINEILTDCVLTKTNNNKVNLYTTIDYTNNMIDCITPQELFFLSISDDFKEKSEKIIQLSDPITGKNFYTYMVKINGVIYTSQNLTNSIPESRVYSGEFIQCIPLCNLDNKCGDCVPNFINLFNQSLSGFAKEKLTCGNNKSINKVLSDSSLKDINNQIEYMVSKKSDNSFTYQDKIEVASKIFQAIFLERNNKGQNPDEIIINTKISSFDFRLSLKSYMINKEYFILISKLQNRNKLDLQNIAEKISVFNGDGFYIKTGYVENLLSNDNITKNNNFNRVLLGVFNSSQNTSSTQYKNTLSYGATNIMEIGNGQNANDIASIVFMYIVVVFLFLTMIMSCFVRNFLA
jgi:hypothetical protein